MKDHPFSVHGLQLLAVGCNIKVRDYYLLLYDLFLLLLKNSSYITITDKNVYYILQLHIVIIPCVCVVKNSRRINSELELNRN